MTSYKITTCMNLKKYHQSLFTHENTIIINNYFKLKVDEMVELKDILMIYFKFKRKIKVRKKN